MSTRFHCCATCEHFQAEKKQNGMYYGCKRLGFETKPSYQFDCWNPKEHIKSLIAKETSKRIE
ncbi:hypothetical protein [Bacillus suaedae]|uniref:Uncharacterized protein n=1 Tax=Halalkalibacter suaedae TaxID=2822140 RepID=A0A940WR44_9BACI|nr:hypothetical protein [Bacillus suaedae]MBP3951169.1 hypothetical protein [Bacillus suaedae]